MYNLEFLPSAREDMVEIVRYISKELHNPAAAERLAGLLVEAAERAAQFPETGLYTSTSRPSSRRATSMPQLLFGRDVLCAADQVFPPSRERLR